MNIEFEGINLIFGTNEDVFSPNGLDLGTKSMLKLADIKEADTILDLGCGYGFVGIYYAKKYLSAKITMVDISTEAIKLSQKNALLNNVKPEIIESNGFEKIKDQKFDIILSNPPYHVDFSVPKYFIENSFMQLNQGGKFYMVTKRRKWYENKIRTVFGNVKVIESNGYYVFYSEKRQKPKKEKKNLNKLSKKLERKNRKKKALSSSIEK